MLLLALHVRLSWCSILVRLHRRRPVGLRLRCDRSFWLDLSLAFSFRAGSDGVEVIEAVVLAELEIIGIVHQVELLIRLRSRRLWQQNSILGLLMG